MTLNIMEHIKQLLDSKELASIYRLVNWLISFSENKFPSPSRSFAHVPCLQDFRVWNKAAKLCPHSEVTPAAAPEFFLPHTGSRPQNEAENVLKTNQINGFPACGPTLYNFYLREVIVLNI